MNLNQLLNVSSLSQAEQSQALLLVVKDLYKKSLYRTAYDLLDYKEMTPNTHLPMVKVLQDKSKRKLICVPRGCFKSSIGVVAYPIWLLLNNPNLRILIDSEKYENSKNFIREIKGKLETQKVSSLFGYFKSDTNWAEGSITIKQRNIVLKESSITASGVAANKTGQHYDVIIHDDMNSDKNSGTQEARQKVIDHYKLNTSILEPNGTMVVIGTRYAADDLIGWILENEIERKGLL